MIIIALVIVGLAFGSFVNAFVWRWHQTHGKKLAKKDKAKYSIVNGRSMCPNCSHVLAAKDLLPVVSWLWLKGKCRYCKKPISWQYPVVELATAALFVVSYLAWPLVDQNAQSMAMLGCWLAVIVIGMFLTVYDFKWMKLPTNIMFGALLPFSIAVAGLHAWYSLNWVVFALAIGGGVLGFGLFYAIYAFSGGRLMGDGDVRLMLPLGILAGGFIQTLALISVASFIALGYILVLLMLGKKINKNSKIPFGPFLLAGTYVVVLWWPTIQNWLVPQY